METVADRFLRYVSVDTQSREDADCFPSTEKQFRLAEMLAEELRSLGAEDVSLNEYCYVTATIPANNGKAGPVIGLIAHMDTSCEASGAGIRPVITENYDGSAIRMSEDMALDPKEYPSLLKHVGETIICTDGTTLLGADDKAGVAEIMTMAQMMTRPDAPKHGPIRIAFTPDEEIGRGTDFFDVGTFGAEFAYTVDGGGLGELNYECFNAASAFIRINGLSIHTGSAKGKMKNASLLAMELHSMLPVFMNPAVTENREGFFHLEQIDGTVEKAEMKYLIRDHDRKLFENKKCLMTRVCDFMNEKYGKGTVQAEIRDTYYNMVEKVDKSVVERAICAMRSVGIEPCIEPIRGGTDGARLSFEGLPCPNLCTGGYNFHGPYEYISVDSMEKIVELLCALVSDELMKEE